MSITTVARNIIPPKIRKPMKRFLYGCVPVEKQKSSDYWRLKRFLSKAQWWDAESTAAWQLEKLQAIVRHAYENVPGYNALYREAGVSPNDIQTLGDIRLLPMVDKATLGDNKDDFAARNYSRWRRTEVHTSGTTGVPMHFYHADSSDWIEDAFMHSGWERAGWHLGDASASLGTRRGGPPEKFWDYDRSKKWLAMYLYQINHDTVRDYIEKINNAHARQLMANPSTMMFFANHVIEAGLVGNLQCDAIFLQSERIDEWHKARLREAFPGVRLFGWYGHSERAILAPWCEDSERYHVWPFYGYTEVLDVAGENVQQGEQGELVGTAFWSFATPFIRYRTMDVGVLGPDVCPDCGRKGMTLDSIDGRVCNVLIASDGRAAYLSPSLGDEFLVNVRQLQYYQDTPGKVLLRLVVRDGYSDTDADAISTEVLRLLGDGMSLKLEIVKEIEFTPGGKVRNLVQRLSMEERGMSALGSVTREPDQVC